MGKRIEGLARAESGEGSEEDEQEGGGMGRGGWQRGGGDMEGESGRGQYGGEQQGPEEGGNGEGKIMYLLFSVMQE